MKSNKIGKYRGHTCPKSNFPKVTPTGEKYKPLSYYVLGGVDLKGDETRLNAQVTYDNEETISEMEENGTIQAIGVCSPNVDIFDIVEKTGSTDVVKDGIKNDISDTE